MGLALAAADRLPDGGDLRGLVSVRESQNEVEFRVGPGGSRYIHAWSRPSTIAISARNTRRAAIPSSTSCTGAHIWAERFDGDLAVEALAEGQRAVGDGEYDGRSQAPRDQRGVVAREAHSMSSRMTCSPFCKTATGRGLPRVLKPSSPCVGLCGAQPAFADEGPTAHRNGRKQLKACSGRFSGCPKCPEPTSPTETAWPECCAKPCSNSRF